MLINFWPALCICLSLCLSFSLCQTTAVVTLKSGAGGATGEQRSVNTDNDSSVGCNVQARREPYKREGDAAT